MLRAGDMFVFRTNGSSFQSDEGRPPRREKVEVNGRLACSFPGAAIHMFFASLLAELLERETKCQIEVLHLPQGSFQFTFKTPPAINKLDPIPSYVMSCERVSLLLERTKQPRLTKSEELANENGCKSIQWMLSTLYGVEFTFKISSYEITFLPPPPKPRLR
jgi:hypothetical protein